MPRRYTEAEVEAMVVPKLVDAIYPILIPVEQQCMQIQEENRKQMVCLATALWRSFGTMKG